MEKSSFFNAVIDQNGVPDRDYLAEDYARYFSTFIGNGIFPNPSNQLQVVATDNNMQIRIKQGKAWINGYMYENTNDRIFILDPADGVLSRIDRIILKLDFLNREIRAHIKKGDYASNAIAKNLQRDANAYEIALADIEIKGGAIKITPSDITDLRLNNSYCGIVHGLVNQVDTTTIFNQYMDWFKKTKGQSITDISNLKTNLEVSFTTWFDNIKNTLGEDVTGNLLNLINKNATSINNINKQLTETATSKVIDGEDCNNIKEIGFYTIQNCKNTPNNYTNVSLLVLQSNSNIQQLAFNNTTIYIRYFNGSSWTAWQKDINNVPHEKGTFTPTLKGNHNYASAKGFYTKIEKEVFINLFICISTKDSTIEDESLIIKNLPFACENTFLYSASFAIGTITNINITDYKQIFANMNYSLNEISIQYLNSKNQSCSLKMGDIENSFTIMLSGNYSIN